MKPVIDMKKCSKCLYCIAYCPQNAIKFVSNKLKIDYEKCNRCFICLRECPEKAISED